MYLTFVRNAAVIAAFLILSATSFAQIPNFTRASDYDVQHYILRVSFDRKAKRVFGDTTVRLKPVAESFRQVTLDSVGITYASVALESGDRSLNYRTQAGKIIIDLDREYSKDEVIGIRFKYSAAPKKGIYFVNERKASGILPGHSAQIWTQGEPEEARYWFPSFDFPSDKATTEQFITAEKNETVIGNGVLVGKNENPDGTITHHFRMDVPFSTYLVSFVIGEFIKVSERYKDIPLGYYVYPGTEYIVPKAYGKTRDMFRIFEELTGVPYPFAKYDQTMVGSFQFGGMENITATTMADTEILAANSPIFASYTEDLVAHELAHSWFGNLVTCKNWAELWLNEGFATLMEAVSREKLYGREAYIAKVKSDAERFLAEDSVNPRRHGLFNRNAANVNSLFDRAGTTYNKGGAVLHTLRQQVGDKAFWRGVNIYLNRHKFGSVEASDLRRAMEEASGSDLKWFFDQWVYGLGAPKVEVTQRYAAATKTLSLTFRQTQRQDRYTPTAFRMPLDVAIHAPGGIRIERVELSKRIETFSYKIAGRPTKLEVDNDENVPIKHLKIVPLNISR
ncbi:MAG TPA: M1 family aminopeptidase [Pyrinomonadaceae bacterium]|nr:M1 family aminopeptidase [Pyrinomonadaceae bacterium]